MRILGNAEGLNNIEYLLKSPYLPDGKNRRVHFAVLCKVDFYILYYDNKEFIRFLRFKRFII